jgi:hypothetical protein
MIAVEPVPATNMPRWAVSVNPAEKMDWTCTGQAVFVPPIPFVIPPDAASGEPFHAHNHCPAVTWCPNGDLLAAWFSTGRERGTEMTILASRLRNGAQAWEPACEFFKAPDRNMTGTALFNDGKGTLHHFNGMGPEGVEGWQDLVVLMRTSRDNGVNWSPPQAISPGARYQLRNQVIAGTSATADGLWLQPCDGTWAGEGPSALHVSRDNGLTWSDAGGDIRGIHAGVAGIGDGRLLAFGRAQMLDGRMPMSFSEDGGRSWCSCASEFPPISGGQRLVLMRLREGAFLFVSFTDSSQDLKCGQRQGLAFAQAGGHSCVGYGLFAAVSHDDGKTWPVRRLVTPGSGEWDGGAWTGRFVATPTQAEPKGYLAATQTPDGMIHLISSRLHYRFNLDWIETLDELVP